MQKQSMESNVTVILEHNPHSELNIIEKELRQVFIDKSYNQKLWNEAE